MEEEQLHEPRFSVGTKDLLQAVYSKRSLILEHRWWEASVLGSNGFEFLGEPANECED